jgi:glycosyltransferase involved in cell wall biosynthesis
MQIYLDDSPTKTGHSIRGIGVYTRNLKAGLLQEFANSDYSLIGDWHLTNNKAQADLIHFPYFDLFWSTLPNSLLLPEQLRKNQKSKIVVTIHDVIPLLFPDHYPVGARGKLAFKLQKQKLHAVDHVITDSLTSKNDIQQFLSYPAKQVSVVPLAAGLDHPFVTQELIDNVIKKYRLPAKYVLYVGDINYNKNLPALVLALKKIPEEVKLVLVGKNIKPQDIPEWHAIETAISKNNLQNRVIRVTNIGENEGETLAAIYQAATVYVQPSLYEGFGLPVLEAMQYRTPVVSANTSSLKEITKEYGTLVEPTTTGLADGVRTILNTPKAQLDAQIQRAAQWAESFTWQKTAQKTIAVYQHVLQKQVPRSA